MLSRRLFGILLIALSQPSAASNERTVWEDAKRSLTQLLNDGWVIQSMSSFNTDWKIKEIHDYANGARPEKFVYPHSYEVNFLLARGGKYAWCAVTDPGPDVQSFSRCRYLN
jgi:hypothetical protein